MLDSLLGKLVLRRIGIDCDACCQALESGAITVADLDHKNEAHKDGLQAWIDLLRPEQLAPIPPIWLSVFGLKHVMLLAPIMPEAKARMVKVIREGFDLEDLQWPESAYPASWANAIEKVLLEKPDWDAFHAVQDRLPTDMTARLRKELAAKIAKQEQKDKEQRRAERSASKPKVDALAESIRSRNASRLRKLPLAKLTKVRWEKHKDEWMKAPAEIVAFAAKVPVEYLRPYEAKILEAVAKQDWEPMPEWPITKSCLQELEVQHQVGFLRKMFCTLINDESFNSIEPEYTWQEIRNLLVAAILQDSDNLNLSRWIDALDTFKYLRSLKGNGTKLSAEEEKQFRMAAPIDGNNYFSSAEWFAGSADDDDCIEVELVVDLLAWVKSQPKEKHPCYAAVLRNNTGVRQLFGGVLKADIK